MGEKQIKLFTQMGIGLGAILFMLPVVESLPMWVLPIGFIVYIVSMWFN